MDLMAENKPCSSFNNESFVEINTTVNRMDNLKGHSRIYHKRRG